MIPFGYFESFSFAWLLSSIILIEQTPNFSFFLLKIQFGIELDVVVVAQHLFSSHFVWAFVL